MSKSIPGEYRSPLIRAGYLVAFLMVFIPVFGLITSVWPLQPGNLRWRFGAAGLLSGMVLLPVVGAFTAMLVAATQRNWLVLRVLAVLTGVSTLIVFLISGMFALDLVQLRGDVRPELVDSYTLTSARALVQLGATWVVGIVITIAGFKVSRTLRRELGQTARGTDQSPLLVSNAAR